MKRLMFSIITLGASMMALSTMGEEITIAEVSVADKPAIEKAIDKFGDLTGMPMLATLGKSLIINNPMADQIAGKTWTDSCALESAVSSLSLDLIYIEELLILLKIERSAGQLCTVLV